MEHVSIQRGNGCACGEGAKACGLLNSLPHVRYFTDAGAYAEYVLYAHGFPALVNFQ